MIRSSVWRLMLSGALAAGLLAACGGSDDDSLDDRADVADPKVRFVHAVPAGPNVTLLRNGTAEPDATDVAYKQATSYYDVGEATYTFTLQTTSGATALDDVELATDRGNRYTLVAVPTTGGVELATIRDPYNKSVTSDDARLRVLNAAANTLDFDVYLTGETDSIDTATPRMSDLTYRDVEPASGSDSIEVEGGVYRLRLTTTGTKDVFFDAVVTVPANGDWLLVVLPDDVALNEVRVLVVKTTDSEDTTDEVVGS